MIYVVSDLDPRADFKALQEAVAALPSGLRAPTAIILRMRAFRESVLIEKNNIRVVGEARDRTILEASEDAALRITGSDVELDHLTIRGDIHIDGRHVILRDVRVEGQIFHEASGSFCLDSCILPGSDKPETVISVQNDSWDTLHPLQTWYLCGDSTMADYPDSAAPRTGWGQALAGLVPNDILINNCAMNGRSSKSFISEERLGMVEHCLRPGDRVLIQFGHNDEKPDKARRTEPRITYPEYLTMYIDAARRQGAEPVLLTSIARRRYDENSCLVSTHGEYPDAMRQLAAEKGIRIIDMERITENILRGMSPDETKSLYNYVEKGHPNYPDGEQDNTHLCRHGAMTYAKAVLNQLL